jgi:hypothetical protein
MGSSLSKKRKIDFAVIDAETDPFKKGRIPQPFIWGFYDGIEYHEFATLGELLAHIATLGKVLIYAHNGGRFDYHYLRDDFEDDSPVMVIAGRIAEFKIGDATFRDSMNFLMNPLSAFQKEKVDYTLFEEDVRSRHMSIIRDYLRSDCINLHNVISAFFARFGKCLTMAGAAMRYWQKHYPSEMVMQDAAQFAKYKPFYYGGRVQCFEHGHARVPFKLIDLNGAYARAMLDQHPLSPEGTVSHRMPKDSATSRCFFHVTAIAQGCFPLRYDGGLYFPDDGIAREYHVTGWEMQAALDLNLVRIVKVHNVHRFPLTLNFAGYITEFYEERKRAQAAGDQWSDIFAKFMQNGLYGKFCSDPDKYSEYRVSSLARFPDWINDGWLRLDNWGDRKLIARPVPDVKRHYYNVCTGASITGYVRAMLMQAMQKCRGLIYCDTDSIAARDISDLPLGIELGEWKLEMTCDEYAIAGKKLYAMHGVKHKTGKVGWKTATKGAKLEPEDIIKVALGEQVLYEPEVPTYSIHTAEPRFVGRQIKSTYRDSRLVPVAQDA